MTVSTSTSSSFFVGAGQINLPLTFRFFENSEVSLYRMDPATGASTLQVYGVDYTLSGAGEPEVNGNATGVIILTSALAVGTNAFVERILPLEQNTDFVNQGRFFSEVHENSFDYLTMLVQQVDAGNGGAIRVSVGEPEVPRLPPPPQRAGRILSFDDNGLPVVIAPASGSATDLAILLESAEGASQLGYRFNAVEAVKRHVDDKLDERFSPLDFGAIGDGVTNDGPALNKAFAYLRSRLSDTSVAITLDLSGRTYASDISINATGLIAWGWAVQNGTIRGRCVGKAVLDMVGSRGGHLRDLVIDGDQASMPRVGIQAARGLSGAFAFCDNMLWDNVTTQGYFSLAGVHLYGQETTTYQHCRFWNYHKDGFAAIHTGFSSFAMSSDYLTPMTGPTSYINNKYLNCDYRYLPVGGVVAITGISKANPAVITAAGHPFVNGQQVVIGFVSGMSEINNLSATVQNVTATTFELAGVNSTAFGTYTGGGMAVLAQSLPTVYLSRGEQQHFDTCYIVNYGSHSIQLDLVDTTHDPKSIWFDCLFEGIGSTSHLEFTNVAGVRNVFDFKLLTYNLHCRDYLIGHTGSGTDVVSLYTAEISALSRSVSSAPLLDLYGKFAMFDARVATINTGMFDPGSMGVNFTGQASWLNGQTTRYNENYVSYLDGVYTPVVSASAGVITSYTATGYQRRIGNLVFFNATITITDNGTGAGSLLVSLPAASAVDAIIGGRQAVGGGAALQGAIAPAGTTCEVTTYNNAYPAATGATLKLSGIYVR